MENEVETAMLIAWLRQELAKGNTITVLKAGTILCQDEYGNNNSIVLTTEKQM